MLWPAAGDDVFTTDRLSLPGPLDLVAAYCWTVRWRRRAPTPFRQQVLTHPVTHLTVEAAEMAEGATMHGFAMPAALVHGLVTRVFEVQLPAAGRVSAVAFRPGGLAALLDIDVRTLTDSVVAAHQVFGPDVDAVAAAVLAEPAEERRRDLLAGYLAEVLAPRLERVRDDDAYRTVREAVTLMRAREVVTLAPVAERLHVAPRTLQRRFARYVGASPLWVLRRYRLQDAVAALDAGEGHDLSELAASLGFADHAHFSRHFAAVVGVPPSHYRDGR